MIERKKVLKMGDKKIIIIPKESEIDVGDWIVFDRKDNLKKFLKDIK